MRTAHAVSPYPPRIAGGDSHPAHGRGCAEAGDEIPVLSHRLRLRPVPLRPAHGRDASLGLVLLSIGKQTRYKR